MDYSNTNCHHVYLSLTNCPRQYNHSRFGFTLVELLITLSVFAIVISLATPKFQSMVSNNQIVTQINNFNGAISFARSEAIKRGQTVSMVATTAANWANGWDIVLPNNANKVIRHIDAFSGNTVLTATVLLPMIQFSYEGRVNTINDIVFTLCNSVASSALDKKGKLLTISPTGITYLDSRYICP